MTPPAAPAAAFDALPRGPEAAASDEALAAAAAGGNRDAFAELVARYERPVHGLCHRMLGSAEEAEDAAQEAFVKAWRALGSFDAARPWKPWLLRIAANTARDAARRRGRRARTIDIADVREESLAVAEKARDHLQRREREEMLAEAVAELGPDAAAAVELFYREEMTHEAIGGVLGRTPAAVAMLLQRTRAKLRAIIERKDPKP
ncbi:MAG: sigma-70 family RNA polymerase sigma factor [Candidatus Sumerlaeia bacterium]|nr:sigma-70 family RNA polymerase sigma factor [Candidatus Sumerlaeia bacterium]